MNGLVKHGTEYATADGRFSIKPLDKGTMGWLAGGRYIVDDSTKPIGLSWKRVASLAEAMAWIAVQSK